MTVRYAHGHTSLGMTKCRNSAEFALRRSLQLSSLQAAGGRGVRPYVNYAGFLHPFQRAFAPDPDVTDNQDGEEDEHFNKAEHAEGFELDRPGKQKNGFHIEHYK
jgi:hypothetical protein